MGLAFDGARLGQGHFVMIVLKGIKEDDFLRTQGYIVLDFPASFEVRKETHFTQGNWVTGYVSCGSVIEMSQHISQG